VAQGAPHPGVPGRVDRVLPDVPAVDRAFDYAVPIELADAVGVGTMVRVPLHGRRVRGWVLGTNVESEAPRDRVLPIRAIVSAGPPAQVVELTEFAAWRWAGPRAAFLRAASAPNVVADTRAPEPDVGVFPTRPAPMDLPDAPARLVVWPPARSRAVLVASMVHPEGSTLLIAPDSVEADALAEHLEAEGRHVVLMRADRSAVDRTAAWDASRRGACVVVGGRVAVLAPVPDLRAVIVLDDADEALAEERAPAWHARDLAHERARREGARFDIVTPAPTVEAVELAGAPVAAPVDVRRAGWPRIEIVDRRDDAPGLGLLSAALGPALHRALDDGGRAVCVLNRRGRAHLLLCRTCGEPARCSRCDATVAEDVGGLRCSRCETVQELRCRHCGSARFRALKPGVVRLRDEIAGLVPHHQVIAVDRSSAPLVPFDVVVGTEAALHRAGDERGRPVRLVAFLDLDQELLAPRYRAAEQSLWLLVRAARLVGSRAGGGVVLVQTRVPDHEVLRTVRDADPEPALAAEAARRRDLRFPPFGGLAELRGGADAVAAACAALEDHVTVLGPTSGAALLRAPSTRELCDALAAVDLAPARALGRLRVDVDPLRV
jgi:primosomal protein N' (replication factor Y)